VKKKYMGGRKKLVGETKRKTFSLSQVKNNSRQKEYI
jgi:hypothetical protein